MILLKIALSSLNISLKGGYLFLHENHHWYSLLGFNQIEKTFSDKKFFNFPTSTLTEISWDGSLLVLLSIGP